MKSEAINSELHPGRAPCLHKAPPAWQVMAAFAAIYVIWGSTYLAIAMQMIAGGILLLVLAVLHGESAQFSFSRNTAASAGAWLYLTALGSLIGCQGALRLPSGANGACLLKLAA